MLALHVGRPVPTDQLVSALWGDEPPPAVKNGLQGLVSKLRRALGSAELVGMRAGGYVLDLDPEAIDVHRYERLVADAMAAVEPQRTIELLAEAEQLWRGDALAEFAYEDFASLPAARLQELRLAAMEEALDVEVDRGGHQAAVVELEAAVAAHPLRERLRGLLMLALYRSGRQADALRVFQDGRTTLGEELGLDPGPELRRLESAILAQDPALDAPAVAPVATPPPRHDPGTADPVGRPHRGAAGAHRIAGGAPPGDLGGPGRRRQDPAGGRHRSRPGGHAAGRRLPGGAGAGR